MPFRFICSQCGATLFECEDAVAYQSRRNSRKNRKREPPIAEFIRRKIGQVCPKCGHVLAKTPLEVNVQPAKNRPKR